MKNKKVVNVLLGVLALMLVVGMAYQFTPDVGSLFGNRQQGTPALKVNGQTVTVEELEALRRSLEAVRKPPASETAPPAPQKRPRKRR